MKAVLYLKLRRKMYRLTPEIDVPDGISFFDAPMAITTQLNAIPELSKNTIMTRFVRYQGMEELLGCATFVFHAPDNMVNLDRIK